MLIAEIGNNHFGEISRACELIRVAKESGADLVKSQAFLSKDLSHGSMPREFYDKCQFTFDQYVYLIKYAKSIGIDLFYSIWSKELEALVYHQNWHKIPARFVFQKEMIWTEQRDSLKTIISVPSQCALPRIRNAHILWACEYLDPDPNMKHLDFLSKHYERSIGFSCHSVGIQNCCSAIKFFGSQIIEKHFMLKECANFNFKGTVFRDTQHATLPHDFSKIKACFMNRGN